jgi:hypothetical protein
VIAFSVVIGGAAAALAVLVVQAVRDIRVWRRRPD